MQTKIWNILQKKKNKKYRDETQLSNTMLEENNGMECIQFELFTLSE